MSAEREPVPIAFCITDLDAGGAERALVQIVTRLDRTQWQPHVICLAGAGALVQPLVDAGIPLTCLGAKRWWNVGAFWKLRRALKRIRPAILQTFLYHANILGRMAARFAGGPIVVSGIRVAERRSRFRLWLDRVTERRVARHVCVSKAVAEFSTTTGGLSPEKTVVIPNGVDFDAFAHATPADLTQFGIEPGDRTLLFVGRLDPQKGIDVLLPAFARVADAHSRLHLLLVGEGRLRTTIEEVARRPELASRVHVAGRRDDVAGLMRAADCLVLPSLWEGMPNVVLEAMAAGLPVIASDVEGVAELLREGACGRLVPPGDADALAQAMAAEVASPSPRPCTVAQDYVRTRLTWDAVAAAYASLYREIPQPG